MSLFEEINESKLNPDALYQGVQRKYAGRIHYTITPIDDITAWRKEQAEINEINLRKNAEKYAEAKERAIELLQNVNETNVKFSEELSKILRGEIKEFPPGLFDKFWKQYVQEKELIEKLEATPQMIVSIAPTKKHALG